MTTQTNDNAIDTTRTPATKPDKVGNFFCFFSPRGFANEGTVYRVPPEHVAQVEAMDSRARRVNGGYANWMDAGAAMRASGGQPMSVTDHPWFEPEWPYEDQ